MLETCNDNEIIFVDRFNMVFDHVISLMKGIHFLYNYELDFYDIKYDIKKLMT